MTASTPLTVLGPAAFARAWAELLAQAPPLWWMCAERFDDWPLEDPGVAEALVAWSRHQTQGEVRVFAREFGWVERYGARFMQWRRLFAHQVQVRRWPQRLPDAQGLPRGVLQPRAAVLIGAAVPVGQLEARISVEAGPIGVALQALGTAWDMGQPALPAHTLGL